MGSDMNLFLSRWCTAKVHTPYRVGSWPGESNTKLGGEGAAWDGSCTGGMAPSPHDFTEAGGGNWACSGLLLGPFGPASGPTLWKLTWTPRLSKASGPFHSQPWGTATSFLLHQPTGIVSKRNISLELNKHLNSGFRWLLPTPEWSN